VQAVSAGYEQPADLHRLDDQTRSAVTVGLAAFAAVELALAVFMTVSPHRFYKTVGPFGAYNCHYIRDVATFYAAIGIALLLAIRNVSWRVPVLAVTTIQYGLHSLNHLLDIGKAHPAWNGYLDFFSLAAATVLLAWLWRTAAREAEAYAVDRTHDAGVQAMTQRRP
jgi:hypothetical protein